MAYKRKAPYQRRTYKRRKSTKRTYRRRSYGAGTNSIGSSRRVGTRMASRRMVRVARQVGKVNAKAYPQSTSLSVDSSTSDSIYWIFALETRFSTTTYDKWYQSCHWILSLANYEVATSTEHAVVELSLCQSKKAIGLNYMDQAITGWPGTIDDIRTSLLQSDSFREDVKILSQRKFTLSPGDSKLVEGGMKVPRVRNEQAFRNAENTADAYPRGAKFLILRVSGVRDHADTKPNIVGQFTRQTYSYEVSNI